MCVLPFINLDGASFGFLRLTRRTVQLSKMADKERYMKLSKVPFYLAHNKFDEFANASQMKNGIRKVKYSHITLIENFRYRLRGSVGRYTQIAGGLNTQAYETHV